MLLSLWKQFYVKIFCWNLELFIEIWIAWNLEILCEILSKILKSWVKSGNLVWNLVWNLEILSEIWKTCVNLEIMSEIQKSWAKSEDFKISYGIFPVINPSASASLRKGNSASPRNGMHASANNCCFLLNLNPENFLNGQWLQWNILLCLLKPKNFRGIFN